MKARCARAEPYSRALAQWQLRSKLHSGSWLLPIHAQLFPFRLPRCSRAAKTVTGFRLIASRTHSSKVNLRCCG